MKKGYPLATLVLILCVSVLAACNTEVGSSAAPTPISSNTLRWAIEGVKDIPNLDPPLTNSNQQTTVVSLIFEGLVKLDSRFNIQPAAAERWTVSPDSRVFTFYLRSNLKFADGREVTATDFTYSLNRALSPAMAAGQARYYLGNILGSDDLASGKASTLKGVEALDRLTLRITLSKPASYFLYQLTFPASFVVPRALIEKYGDKWSEYAYGSGPFKLNAWQRGQQLTLVPNPNYAGSRPYLTAIVMPFFEQPAAAFAAYQRGEVEIMGTQGFDPANLAAAQSTSGLVQAAQFNITYIGFNHQQPPLDNLKLRRALAQSVDKQQLADKVLTSTVEAADTILPPGMPGYNFDIRKLTYNPDAAKQSLANAVLRQPITLTITLNGQDPSAVAAAHYLQQSWQTNLGLMVQLQAEELSRFSADLDALVADPAASNIQMYLSVWGADYPDPQNFLSQQLRSGVGNNNGHYANPNFDRLVDQADAERDLSKRIPLYREAEQLALDDVAWLPLYYGKATALVSPTVRGLTYTAQGLFADDWAQVSIEK